MENKGRWWLVLSQVVLRETGQIVAEAGDRVSDAFLATWKGASFSVRLTKAPWMSFVD